MASPTDLDDVKISSAEAKSLIEADFFLKKYRTNRQGLFAHCYFYHQLRRWGMPDQQFCSTFAAKSRIDALLLPKAKTSQMSTKMIKS